jgi:NAD(P)-dependent dehydrogenase (short-subunit alcohol dehydrogenase family)
MGPMEGVVTLITGGGSGLGRDYASRLDQIPLDKLESALDEIMAVNFKGYLFAAVAARAELAKTNGSITLTLSTSASSARHDPGLGNLTNPVNGCGAHGDAERSGQHPLALPRPFVACRILIA